MVRTARRAGSRLNHAGQVARRHLLDALGARDHAEKGVGPDGVDRLVLVELLGHDPGEEHAARERRAR